MDFEIANDSMNLRPCATIKGAIDINVHANNREAEIGANYLITEQGDPFVTTKVIVMKDKHTNGHDEPWPVSSTTVQYLSVEQATELRDALTAAINSQS